MKKLIIIILSITIIILGLATFGYINILDKKEALRIGLNAWPGYEFLYLAKVKNFYKEEGVDVDIIQYDSLEDVRYGYEVGQIDIMASTITELLIIRDRKKEDIKIILLPDFSNGGDVMVADKSISSVKDLKGKKIAVEPQSLGVVVLSRALNKHNLKLSDVELVGVSQSYMLDVIKNKQVDAAVTYPPISVNILKGVSNSHQIFDTSEIPGEIIDIVSANAKLITDRFDDIKAIQRAWGKAIEYAKNNSDDAYEIMADRERISKEEFEDVLSGVKILSFEDQQDYLKDKNILNDVINLTSNILFENKHITKQQLNVDLVADDVFK